MKRKLLNLTIYTILLFVAVLLNSCTMVPIVLDARYQRMPSPRAEGERVIDEVVLSGKVYESNSKDGYPSTPSPKRMGNTYNVFEKQGSQRHRDESILDQLLNKARQMYPNEAIDIRNATEGAERVNTRTESGSFTNKDGQTTRWTSYIAKFQTYYIAEIVIAEPIPQPPSHSVEIPLIGVSRADLYRRAYNWLTDTKSDAVRIVIDDFDRGRLQGEYDIVITHGLTYLITSTFTIDVHDERADIRFEKPRLRRHRSRQDEPIFLQSIANKVQTEMGVFSEDLKHSTSSR